MDFWIGIAALTMVVIYGSNGFAVACILLGASILIDFMK